MSVICNFLVRRELLVKHCHPFCLKQSAFLTTRLCFKHLESNRAFLPPEKLFEKLENTEC